MNVEKWEPSTAALQNTVAGPQVVKHEDTLRFTTSVPKYI